VDRRKVAAQGPGQGLFLGGVDAGDGDAAQARAGQGSRVDDHREVRAEAGEINPAQDGHLALDVAAQDLQGQLVAHLQVAGGGDLLFDRHLGRPGIVRRPPGPGRDVGSRRLRAYHREVEVVVIGPALALADGAAIYWPALDLGDA